MFLVQLLGTTDSTAAGDGDGHFENQVSHTQLLGFLRSIVGELRIRKRLVLGFILNVSRPATRFSLGAW